MQCQICARVRDLHDTSPWTDKQYVVKDVTKSIELGVWCNNCTHPFFGTPGRCSAVPSSTCLNQNEVVIIQQSNGEERFSCLSCATATDVHKFGFVLKE